VELSPKPRCQLSWISLVRARRFEGVLPDIRLDGREMGLSSFSTTHGLLRMGRLNTRLSCPVALEMDGWVAMTSPVVWATSASLALSFAT
jgi:hypothetical protein